MGYLEIFLVFISLFFFLCYSFHNKNGIPTNWPLVGMLPALLKNHSRIHDFIFEIGEKAELNFLVKGPWFTNMKLMVTLDPANTNYILSKNFGNYPKGSKFKEIFEILGDGIFNADSEVWMYHRKLAQSFFGHPKFNDFLTKIVCEKIETGLIPIFDDASKQRSEIELHDLFRRLTFDTICTLVMDYDPKSFSIDMPDLPFSKAVHDAEEAILYRHILPTCIWKFQRWLGFGPEKKYKEAWRIVDDFIFKCISMKREEISKDSLSHASKLGNEMGFNLRALLEDDATDSSVKVGVNSDKFLRDTILSFLVAGQETTGVALSWFFYLLSTNPNVLFKIKEEFDTVLAQLPNYQDEGEPIRDRYNILIRKFGELNDKLIYLHAAICETLRLYPPLGFNAKAPMESDTLPSGHQVDSSMQIIFCTYGMGRMKSIWGDDCHEFKPERWILETGKIKYEPSYKFLTFGSGPRTCIGKNMTLIVMKLVIIATITKYDIEVVEGHPVIPDVAIILHMKHGLKVKVATR